MSEGFRDKTRILKSMIGEQVTLVDIQGRTIAEKEVLRTETEDGKDVPIYYVSGYQVPIRSIVSVSFEDRRIEINPFYSGERK